MPGKSLNRSLGTGCAVTGAARYRTSKPLWDSSTGIVPTDGRPQPYEELWRAMSIVKKWRDYVSDMNLIEELFFACVMWFVLLTLALWLIFAVCVGVAVIKSF